MWESDNPFGYLSNSIEWIHIMDAQPENEAMIVQVDGPNEIGMRKYVQFSTFEEYLKFCRSYDIPHPNFYWMYAKDFPFPDFECKAD